MYKIFYSYFLTLFVLISFQCMELVIFWYISLCTCNMLDFIVIVSAEKLILFGHSPGKKSSTPNVNHFRSPTYSFHVEVQNTINLMKNQEKEVNPLILFQLHTNDSIFISNFQDHKNNICYVSCTF